MTVRSRARRLAPAVVLLSGAACRDQSPTSPPPCAAAVAVSAGRGPQPALDWRPACAVASVTVVPAGAGLTLPLWQAAAPAGALGPPVRVGASPRGAVVWGAGASLTPGAPYTVYVARGGRGDPAAGVDSLTFTAQP